MPESRRFPTYCCQLCGEPIGYLGRAFEAVFGTLHKHRMPDDSLMHPAYISGFKAGHAAGRKRGRADRVRDLKEGG